MKTFFYFIILIGLGLLTACHTPSEPTLKVAATSVPHAEILEHLKPDLQSHGIHLDIVVVEDFNTPNRALNDREVDANFFQHLPFLTMQNQELGYSLESLVAVHLEPMGLYSKKVQHVTDIKTGASVAIPSDPTNQARALNLLEKCHLITLNRHDSQTSLLNISANPYSLHLIELDSPLLSRTLEDVELAAISTNFALQAGLSPKRDALAQEDAHSLFVNIVAIRAGESQRPDLLLLKQLLSSEKTRHFIEVHYQGVILPAF